MLKHVRKITKVSTHSYSINIPKEIMQKYGWSEKQKLVIEDKGKGRLEVRDWRSKK